MFQRSDMRLDPHSTVRLAVVGNGCALSVGGQWLMLNQLAPELTTGGFQVRVVSEWVKVSKLRFAPL